jgi:hypothetical protein
MQGINSSSCRRWFKKLDIINKRRLYIYSLMLFVVNNIHYFPTISSVHEINTRYSNQLHVPLVTLSATHRHYLFCHQDIQQITN